jgi:hypothetical protein
MTTTMTMPVKASEQLYNIFKHDRSELVDFLLTNWSYFELRQCFAELHTKYPKGTINISVLKELFTGEIGFEANKQEAIYELPTKEFIFLIHVLCVLYKVEDITEHMADMGLVARMLLSSGLTIPIKAYDGNRWIQTLSKKKMFNVEPHLLLQDIIADKQTTKTLNLFVWPCPLAIEDELHLFLKHVNPYVVVIVGEIRMYTNIQSIFTNNKYKNIEFNVPQISFRDVITTDIHIQKSSILIAININVEHSDVTHEIIREIGLKLFGLDLKLSKPYMGTDDEILEEMKSLGFINPLIL